jgi:hypothetical protein
MTDLRNLYTSMFDDENFRGKIYTNPISVIAEKVSAPVVVIGEKDNESMLYPGVYLHLKDETGQTHIPVYSDFQIQATQGSIKVWDLVIFEAITDVPKFRITAGRRKLYAFPHPFPVEDLNKNSYLG